MIIQHNSSPNGEYVTLINEKEDGPCACIRKADSYPSSPTDGILVMGSKEYKVEDRGLVGGRTYYYCLVNVTDNTITNCPEVVRIHPPPSNICAEPIDGGIFVTCTVPMGCRRIRLKRTVGGGDITIKDFDVDDSFVYEDRTASNPLTEYTYSLSAVYDDGIESPEVQTRQHPDEVLESPTFKATVNGTDVSVDLLGRNDVELFKTIEPLNLYRVRLPLEELAKLGAHRIDLKGDSFSMPANTLWHVYPGLRAGTSYLMGKDISVSTFQDAIIGKVEKTKDGFTVSIRYMPESAVAIRVKCDSTSDPEKLEDNADIFDERIDRGRLERIHNDVLIATSGTGYIRVFTEYSRGFSKGVGKSISTIRPEVKYYFTKISSKGAEILFESNDDTVRMLPAMVIVENKRARPYIKKDGTVIDRIDGVSLSNGRGSSKVMAITKANSDRVALFFEEFDDERRYILPYGGRR